MTCRRRRRHRPVQTMICFTTPKIISHVSKRSTVKFKCFTGSDVEAIIRGPSTSDHLVNKNDVNPSQNPDDDPFQMLAAVSNRQNQVN